MSPKPLSRKQAAILASYCNRETTAQIVRRLHTTRTALKRHKETICRKLGVRTIAAAVDILRARGL